MTDDIKKVPAGATPSLAAVKVGDRVWRDETYPHWRGRKQTELVTITHVAKGRLYICAPSLWGQWRYGFSVETGKAKHYEGNTLRYATPDEVAAVDAEKKAEEDAETAKREAKEARRLFEEKAINSYEASQERIRVLTEALQGLVDAVTRWKTPKDFGGFLNNAHIQAIAALSIQSPDSGGPK